MYPKKCWSYRLSNLYIYHKYMRFDRSILHYTWGLYYLIIGKIIIHILVGVLDKKSNSIYFLRHYPWIFTTSFFPSKWVQMGSKWPMCPKSVNLSFPSSTKPQEPKSKSKILNHYTFSIKRKFLKVSNFFKLWFFFYPSNFYLPS